jgi:Transglycosylase SLT domain
VRRLVHHAIAGVGFSAFIATTAIAGLSSPSEQGIASADPVLAVPAPSSPAATPDASARRAAAEARAARKREVDRSAVRATLAANAAQQASRRVKTLARHGKSVAAEEAKLRAAAARAKAAAEKAKAEAARARAAAAKAEAEAAAARKRALANRGYTPGTSDPRQIAREILRNKYGYGDDQFSCFDNIIMRESMWNVHATNPSSGAYGIPQALPGSKMASVASDWRTNPATQIIWGINYMDDRYGSPCEAWVFKRAHGWY